MNQIAASIMNKQLTTELCRNKTVKHAMVLEENSNVFHLVT